MILVQGEKYACLNCIRGHRSSTCDHTNRPLVQVRRRGRPNHACQHRLAVIAEPTCSCGMTAVLVPEHSVAGIKEEDKKPSSAGKKNTKSVGIIRIGAHSKKIIDTSNGKVTVLDTPVNQFLKENPSGNCTCAASGLEPEEYFDRLKQKSSCCSGAKEEKPSNGCCSGRVKVEEGEKGAVSAQNGNGHVGGHVSSHVNGSGNGHTNGHANNVQNNVHNAPNTHPNPANPLPGVNTIYQGPGLQPNGYQYNSYYQQPSYMYNSAYYAGHTVQLQQEGGSGQGVPQSVPQSIPQGHNLPQNVSQGTQSTQSHNLSQNVSQGTQSLPHGVQNVPQGQNVQVMTQVPQVMTQPAVASPQHPELPISQNPNSPMFGQIDPSFSQMWKGESPQQPPQQPVSADSGPEDRLTPEEFFDMYFAPTCSIPGQCGCGDGCQCKGCPTHDSQTELEGVSSGERFTWE